MSARNKIKKINKMLNNVFNDLRSGKALKVNHIKKSVSQLSVEVMSDANVFNHLSLLEERNSTLASKSVRVFVLFLAFSKHIGINKLKLLEAGKAALLHDFGMATVPNDMFNNMSLSESEKRILIQHPDFAVDVLARKNVFSTLMLKIIRHHHENVDGSGYPDNLVGNEINLYSRMLNITCTYEAITRDRIYRQSISPFDAVSKLLKKIGTQLDGRLVYKFIETLGLFPEGSTVELSCGERVQVQRFSYTQGYLINNGHLSYFISPSKICRLVSVKSF